MAGSFASPYSDEDDSATLSDINVTPLVDVTLVLLIVFMITVPLMVSSAPIKVNVPETSAVAQLPDPLTLVISLRREASGELSLYLNDQPTTHNELRTRLAAYSKIAEDLPPVILAADKDLPYAEVIKVIDLIYAVGIRRVSLDTKHTPSP
jgi:biopolymer transport protein ExbD